MSLPKDKPDYFRELVSHAFHKTALTILVLLVGVCLWRRLWPIAFALIAAEALFLLFAPKHPAFRRVCDEKHTRELEKKRAVVLDQIASRLSANAKARYDGVLRLQGKILDMLRTQPTPDVLESLWMPRLKMLTEYSLRLLVSIDATRADVRDQRALENELTLLERELTSLSEGNATLAIKKQKLELTRSRLEEFSKLRDRREAAIVQFEIVESLLEQLLSKGLASHDEEAFASQLELLSGQVEALGDSLGSMAQDQSAAYELASLKALNT